MANSARTGLAFRRPLQLLVAAGLVAVIGWTVYGAAWGLWADHHFRAAQRALDRDDLDQGRAHLKLCLEVRPRNPDVLFLLARTERRLGTFDDAEYHLVACERHGGDPEAVALERLLRRAQNGDLAGVETFLENSGLTDNADLVAIYEALSQGYLKTFRLPLAVNALNQWLALEPQRVRALLWRGKALDRLRSSAQALRDFRRAVELAPDNPEALRLLGEGLLQASAPREALAHYLRLREMEPGDPEVALGLARCRLALGELDPARNLLDVLLAEYPRNGEALALRGRLELDLARPAQAEPLLRRAVALVPYSREAVYNFVRCLNQLKAGGQVSAAREEELKRWTDRLDQIQVIQKQLGSLTARMKDAPRDAGLRCEAGKVFLDMGNVHEGLRWLESALQEDPAHAGTHRLLRDHYRASGRPDLAAVHERALRGR
jgi:tetratricopeptide (TPR) repeat protein